MSDFEFEKGRLQDNLVAASQAGLSAIDPGCALLQKLRHSSHIVEDLASLYTTHPYEYAKIMRQLRGPLGDAKVRRLNRLIQEKREAAAKA